MTLVPGITNNFGEAQALQYGGQSTVEAVSVSPVVAGNANVKVTTTSATNVLSYTPAQDGVFRVEAYYHLNNGTSSNAITLSVAYTDQQADASATTYMVTGATLLNAAASQANGYYPCAPMLIVVKGGTTVTIDYTDGGNTPDDYVTAIISQVA